MPKIQKSIINVISLLLLCGAFWVCNLYPRHILEFGYKTSIVSVLVNLAFFILFDYLLIAVFSLRETVYSGKVYKKENLIRLLLTFAIELVFDGVFIGLEHLGGLSGMVLADIAVIIEWMAIYSVLARGKNGIFSDVKSLALVCAAAAVLIAVGAVLDNVIIAEEIQAAEKFIEGSEILAAFENNAYHWHSLILLGLDILFGGVLMCAHICRGESEPRAKASIVLLRIVIAVAAVVSLAMLKTHFWPYDSIVGTDQSHSKLSVGASAVFPVETDSFRLYRFSPETDGKLVCFSTSKAVVYYGGSQGVCVNTPLLGRPYGFVSDGERIIETQMLSDAVLTGERQAYIFRSSVICYYADGVPQAVGMNALSSLEENVTVTEVCERELSLGNVYIFEYCRDYLLKYDPEFIKGYIDRYSKVKFTGLESEWMEKNCYDPEYVKSIAD